MGQEGGAPDGVETGREGGQFRPSLAHRAEVGRAPKCTWCKFCLYSDRSDVGWDPPMTPPETATLVGQRRSYQHFYTVLSDLAQTGLLERKGCSLWVWETDGRFLRGRLSSWDCKNGTWRIAERGKSRRGGMEEVGAGGMPREGKEPEKAREWQEGSGGSASRLQPLPRAGCWGAELRETQSLPLGSSWPDGQPGTGQGYKDSVATRQAGQR